MITIEYPEPTFRIKEENEETFIFDPIRKQWLVLTDEEWVRQNFIQYLVQGLKYPASLIAIEKEIYLGELKKRFDILIYNSHHQPWMLIECKSPHTKIDMPVLEQILRYGISVPADFLVITNGNNTYGWLKSVNGLNPVNELPFWKAI
ncbi:MAG: type I restriction enzyme HsdR N-terminal domain-containing protein [Bacteroidetes bacterium]|nr:type I restriction enzyme HsdR N-terminal domain-containing protein [Bacteroidota bacterium]MBS1609755.1 type I restriction enzyme HsdR N-terminal domain-containing protein [Bacteroidota bacterium]